MDNVKITLFRLIVVLLRVDMGRCDIVILLCQTGYLATFKKQVDSQVSILQYMQYDVRWDGTD